MHWRDKHESQNMQGFSIKTTSPTLYGHNLTRVKMAILQSSAGCLHHFWMIFHLLNFDDLIQFHHSKNTNDFTFVKRPIWV